MRLSFKPTRSKTFKRNFQSLHKEVNNHRIRYEKTGEGEKVVLFLPGAIGCSSIDFLPQLEHFNSTGEYTVIAWDPPGYGFSRPPERSFEKGWFERDAEDAYCLMKKLGFEKYSVCGWSDGGNTAAILAVRHPQEIEKMVLWGANAFVTKGEIDVYESIRDVDLWNAKMRDPMVAIYGDYFSQLWGEWIDAYRVIQSASIDGDIYNAELTKISCPTLIIHGLKDRLVPDFHPKNLHDKISESKLIYWDNAGHGLHLQHHEEFNSLVRSFLKN